MIHLDPSLNLTTLRLANNTRAARWHGVDSTWTGADWSNAMAGEMGEAANVVKKIRRGEDGCPSERDPDRPTLIQQLGDEIADVLIYADLLAAYYGIDMGAAVKRKFNLVSEREGFPERI